MVNRNGESLPEFVIENINIEKNIAELLVIPMCHYHSLLGLSQAV